MKNERDNQIQQEIMDYKGLLEPYRKPGESMDQLVSRAISLVANTEGIPLSSISPKTKLRGLKEIWNRIQKGNEAKEK